MSLDDGVQQLLERMEPARLAAVGNDALQEELRLLEAQMQAQRVALDRVRNIQAVQRHFNAENGVDSAIEDLVGRLQALTAAMGRFKRLADRQAVQDEGGDVDVRTGSTVSDIEGSEAMESAEDVASVVSNSPREEQATASVSGLQDTVDRSCQSPRNVAMLKQMLMNDDDTSDDDETESPSANSDTVDHQDAELQELEAASHVRPVDDQGTANANSPPAMSTISQQSNSSDVVIKTTTIAGFASTCLERCQQLTQRETVTEAELSDLFNYIQALIPTVDGCVTPNIRLTRLLEVVRLATKLPTRCKLEKLKLFGLVDPVQAALLACSHSELSSLAKSVARETLTVMLPAGFIEHDTYEPSIKKTWNVLTQLKRWHQADNYDPRIMNDWFEHFGEVLSQPRFQQLSKVVSAPLLFVELSVIVHLTIKLALLEQILYVIGRLEKANALYDGGDNLLDVYLLELHQSHQRRLAGDTSDREKQYDFDKEIQRITDKLRWYFQAYEDV